MKKILLKPSKSALVFHGIDGETQFKLTGLDHACCQMVTNYVFRFEDLLDVDIVCKGLQLTIDECPLLSARLSVDTIPFRFVDIMNGVNLTVVEIEADIATIPSVNSKLVAWEETGIFDLLLPENATKFLDIPNMAAVFYLYPKHQVSLLAVSLHHSLADGSSGCKIIQRWSHYCTKCANSSATDVTLDEPLVLVHGRSKILDKNFNVDIKDVLPETIPVARDRVIIANVVQDKIKAKPLKKSASKDLCWTELRIDLSKAELLKNRVMSKILSCEGLKEALGDDVEWISRYELCQGLIIAAMLRCKDASAVDGFTSFNVRSHLVDHLPLANEVKIGNGINRAYFQKPNSEIVTMIQQSEPDVAIGVATAYFHSVFRNSLSKKKELSETISWYQQAVDSYGWMYYPPCDIERAIAKELYFFNSWAAFPFLEINMGSKKVASASVMGREAPGYGNYRLVYAPSSDTWGMIVSFATQEEKMAVDEQLLAFNIHDSVTII